MEVIKVSIAACRVNAGLTQAELADKMGISIPTVASWEKGKGSPDLNQLRILSQLSGIPMDNIFLSGDSI